MALYIALLISLTCVSADTEWVSLKGKVVDSANQTALIGAKVTIPEAGIVVYTDPDGMFSVDVPSHQLGNITVEYISYEPQEFQPEVFSNGSILELSSR